MPSNITKLFWSSLEKYNEISDSSFIPSEFLIIFMSQENNEMFISNIQIVFYCGSTYDQSFIFWTVIGKCVSLLGLPLQILQPKWLKQQGFVFSQCGGFKSKIGCPRPVSSRPLSLTGTCGPLLPVCEPSRYLCVSSSPLRGTPTRLHQGPSNSFLLNWLLLQRLCLQTDMSAVLRVRASGYRLWADPVQPITGSGEGLGQCPFSNEECAGHLPQTGPALAAACGDTRDKLWRVPASCTCWPFDVPARPAQIWVISHYLIPYSSAPCWVWGLCHTELGCSCILGGSARPALGNRLWTYLIVLASLTFLPFISKWGPRAAPLSCPKFRRLERLCFPPGLPSAAPQSR